MDYEYLSNWSEKNRCSQKYDKKQQHEPISTIYMFFMLCSAQHMKSNTNYTFFAN